MASAFFEAHVEVKASVEIQVQMEISPGEIKYLHTMLQWQLTVKHVCESFREYKCQEQSIIAGKVDGIYHENDRNSAPLHTMNKIWAMGAAAWRIMTWRIIEDVADIPVNDAYPLESYQFDNFYFKFHSISLW